MQGKVSLVPVREPPDFRILRAIELGLALALLVAFLGFRDLPLVDLPQHALQLANWMRIDAGDASVSDLELNFRTPYLLAYPVARLLAEVVPVLIALKLTFWLAIVLQARCLSFLCKALGHDPWLGLLGYPLGLGYSFCFGFVSFCAAVPLVYLAFAFAARHRLQPTLRSSVQLALTLAALLVAHGVALGFTLALLGPLLLTGSGSFWRRVLPLASAPLLGALWLFQPGGSTRLGGDTWRLEMWRWLELPAQLVSIGSADRLGSVLGVLLILVVVWHLGAPRSPWWLVPFIGALIGYGFFPTLFRGAGPLGPRFSVYLVPAALLAFAPRPLGIRAERARRALIASVASAGALLFCARLLPFQAEVAEYRALASELPPGRALRPLVFERGSDAFPGIPAHLHVPAYYSVEKGGHPGYSFAMYSISVVRFRPGVRIKMGGGKEWVPEAFDAARESGDYDYFLVRSSSDPTKRLFGDSGSPAELQRQIGRWWAYRSRVPLQGSR
jgi:hypothetical protein